MSGFRKFLMRGNIIDLAVAVVIGVAFNGIVQALVKYMITPLITAITGNGKPFSNLSFTVHHSEFTYGQVINAVLSFLVIAAVIYWLIVAPAAKLTAIANRNKAAIDRECPECLSQIPIGAKRCMYCTSEVPPTPVPEVDPSVPILRRARHRSLASE
jgi:large conductance mechanosensitive channel